MKALIKRLCDANGVGGGDIATVIEQEVSSVCDEIRRDTLGNVIAIRHCGKEHAPLIMLEAHMDEIGFVVTHVDDQGFIHVASCGGIDRRVLAACEVTVFAKRPLPGVFCTTPPHLSDGEKTIKPLDRMGIDVGLPADEVKVLVSPGTRVGFRSHFEELAEYVVCSKSLDNRVGCAAVISALQCLCDEDLTCDVVALFAVQEEIGGAGAVTAAFSVFPDAAFVTDVSFGYTPDASRYECGLLGDGPMIGMAPGLDDSLICLMQKVAKNAEITVQQEVMGGNTGTDADHIITTQNGVPTALISIPQRYMHTPVETVDVQDVEAVARLMALAVKEYTK